MSDTSNWEAIGAWVSSVGFQVGTALQRLWKSCKRERPMETGYERVQRGETVEGWKLVISPDRIPGKYKRYLSPSDTLVTPPWRNDANDIHSEIMEYSVLMQFKDYALEPGGRSVYELSQYSLIADVDKTIARVEFDYRQWGHDRTYFVGHRVVAVAFYSKVMLRRSRLVLVDVASKRHQSVLVESPLESPGHATMVTVRRHQSSMNMVDVLYSARLHDAPNAVHQQVFCDASYEIPTDDADPDAVIKPSSQQAPLILGDCRLTNCTRFSGFPPIIIARNMEPNGDRSVKVVSFDQPGKWQITPVDEWFTAFRSTQFGRRCIDALDALDSLSPEPSWPVRQMDYIYTICKLHRMLYGYENGNAVYSVTKEGGLMRRWINPPSLKYLAAEAVCQAHPEANMSELKDRIGFDVFDGMMDKNYEAPIIYL